MNAEAVRPWLDVVAADVKATRNCLFGPEPTTAMAAYHCQQTAEKLAKAVLAGLGIEVPFTHNIGELAAHLPDDLAFGPRLHGLARLTHYATAYRYPTDDPPSLPPEPAVAEAAAWVREIEATAIALRAMVMPGPRPPDLP
ncbi:MAG: HEPN domain-containing protein [Pseudomonadota bacterium]